MSEHLCGLENAHVLSVFRHDYRESALVLVLSHHGPRVALSGAEAL